MKIWKKIGLMSVIIILFGYLCVVLIWMVPSTDEIICEQIKVVVTDGNKHNFICENDVEIFLKQKGLSNVGKPFSEIPLRKIEQELLTNAALRHVQCYRTGKGTLLIKVSQRIPVFRVMSGSASYYVDNERETMPTVLRHTAYVPIVTGSVNRQMATGSLFDLIVYIQGNSFLKSQVSQIHVYPNGDVELIPRIGNQVIYIGQLDNYESKLQKLIVFYDKAISKVGWNNYSKIDLQFKDQVVCTRR